MPLLPSSQRTDEEEMMVVPDSQPRSEEDERRGGKGRGIPRVPSSNDTESGSFGAWRSSPPNQEDDNDNDDTVIAPKLLVPGLRSPDASPTRPVTEAQRKFNADGALQILLNGMRASDLQDFPRSLDGLRARVNELETVQRDLSAVDAAQAEAEAKIEKINATIGSHNDLRDLKGMYDACQRMLASGRLLQGKLTHANAERLRLTNLCWEHGIDPRTGRP
ncbi:hypothetical protein BAUCODRAFT_565937 [Baudoinia panamericana UAMH 10762]|uniref:Uncharacterized protein n=1 Tax=Baudoinia panamericana (strain UAMH 10762) TaxID=717646 RepID=M2MTN6_BAUPA|nr:uncharacterized protein BAUCODRAFT_565937 [Baudoinia panamericana UAMH 10762]EMC94898.1 hypothetical protein BAUCODRAFT_565937 [Baudoinia panamericana UAMH 10762]